MPDISMFLSDFFFTYVKQTWNVNYSNMVNHGQLCHNYALTMVKHRTRFVKWHFSSTMIEPKVDHAVNHGWTMVINHGQP